MKKAAPNLNWRWRAAKSSMISARRKRNARGSASVADCCGGRAEGKLSSTLWLLHRYQAIPVGSSIAPSASMIQTSRYCPETTPTLLGFSSIQCIKREQDLAGLTSQRRFIAAEPIKCEIRQIRQTQKAAGEFDGIVSFHVTVRVGSSKQGMNNVSRIR